jgi:spermidine/putrescine transport system permease protein
MLLGLLVVPFATLVIRSFWTQVNFDYDTTFTLNNYAKIFALGWKENVELFNLKIDWPFTNAIYVLLAKSILMSIAVTTVVILRLSDGVFSRLPGYAPQGHLAGADFDPVLDQLSAPHLRLEGDSRLQRRGQFGTDVSGANRSAARFHLYNSPSVIITRPRPSPSVLPIYVSLEDGQVLLEVRGHGDTAVGSSSTPCPVGARRGRLALRLHPDCWRYVTPEVVGGTSGIMVGSLIKSLYGKSNDWPLGSALSIVMMLSVAALVMLFLWGVGYMRMRQRMA